MFYVQIFSVKYLVILEINAYLAYMKQMKSFKGIYLMVAFAIFWVSFASIIQFHLSQIHGEDFTSTIEFVKSDSKSLKTDPKVKYHSDLNTDLLLVDENESNTLYIQLQKSLVGSISESVSHLCANDISLRGPPSL